MSGCAAEVRDGAGSSAEEAIALKRSYAIAIDSGTDPASPAELNARWVGYVTVAGDSAMKFRVQPCAVVSSKVAGGRALIPDQVLEAVPQLEVSGRLDHDSLHVDDVALLFGVRLDNPLTDPLPSSADEARDHDGDGHAGFRLDGPSGPVDVGMRVVVGLDGRVDHASGGVWGDARLSVETKVYDAPNVVKARSTVARGYVDPLDVDSIPPPVQRAVRRFKLVPLPGAPTCRAAAALVGVVEPTRSVD